MSPNVHICPPNVPQCPTISINVLHMSPKCSPMSFNVHQMSPYVPQKSPYVPKRQHLSPKCLPMSHNDPQCPPNIPISLPNVLQCPSMSTKCPHMSPKCPHVSPKCPQSPAMSPNMPQCPTKYPHMSPKCPHMSPNFTSYIQILLCSPFSEARARTSVELVVGSREGRPKAGPSGFPRPVPHFSARSASEKMKQKKGKGESKSALQSQFLPRIESSFTCQKMSLLALTVAE